MKNANQQRSLAVRILCMVLAGIMIATGAYSAIYFLFFA